MAGPEERGGRGAGGRRVAQGQGQPRDSAMAPLQPSLGPPKDEPRVFGLGKGRGGGRFGCNNFKGGRGTGGYGSDNKSYGRGRGRFDGECHYCHKSGHMWRDCFKLPSGWTPAQGQEGRGARGGRGRGRRGRGDREGGAANMKNGNNESELRDDRFLDQFFFVSTQAPAAPKKDESFEKPAAMWKVTLHSLYDCVIDSCATYSMTLSADLLTKLEPSLVKHVTSTLGQRAEVKGMGKAMFKGADGKMVGKAIWAVHLGMAQNSKGWLLWDPFTKKCLLSSGSTTTRKSSLVNGGEEAKDGEEEEEEVQQVSEHAPTLPSRTTSAPRIRVTPQQRQGLHVPVAEEERRGKRRIQAPNRLTYDALGKPAKSALDGVALMIGDDEESDYEECAFAFFSPVEMSREPATLKEALESSDAEEWKKEMESELKSIEENGTWELPEGFDDGSGRVRKLKKVLYGLKQAPRQWYLKLREVLEEIGFTPSSADHSLFMLGEGEQRSFMVVYVDNILIFSPSSDLVKEVMLKLQDKFKCKALGDVSFYLGLHIERDVEKRCMRVHQRKYLEALAANFGQSEGHVATPFPSGFKCVKGPEEESVGEEERHHFHSLVAAGMRVAKYLGQTPIVGLQYSAAARRRQKGADGVEPGCLFLTAFLDASYASEQEDMTSVGGFICCVGGGPTSWESKKQVDQALSSVESEYMTLFHAVREIVWQRRLLAELGEEQQGPTPIYCDSQGAITLAKNPVLHGLTKHMRVK
ncbi:unnamed protein product [Closterium sp. NIES-54]